MRKLFVFGSLLIAYLLAFPQQEQVKYEQEERVKAERVPAAARSFIAGCGFTERLKWYRETSQDGHTFEAKVKSDGIRYSIEFDSVGQLQDVELNIKWDDIPTSTQAQIREALADSFQRHRIQKIQLQWTGAVSSLQKLIRKEEPETLATTQYEIVLRGKSNGETHWYEILFDEEGKIARKSRFVPRNTDNLDF